MITCDANGKNLLPYLYDLLDPAETLQVEKHLEGCLACRTQLAQMRSKQDLLKETVREAFPDVTFQAPKETGRVEAAPTVVLPRRTPTASRSWLRVCVAASLLLAATGVGLFVNHQLSRRSDDLARALQVRDQAEKDFVTHGVNVRRDRTQNADEIKQLHEEIENLKKNWNRDRKDTQTEIQRKAVHFQIQKPSTITPGAQNPIKIQVRGQMPKKVQVAVLHEKSKRTIFEQEFVGKPEIAFELPRDLHLDDDQELSLVVRSDDPSKPGQMIEVRDYLKSSPEYMTHLATDRPMYRPGDVVRFRSLTLDRFSFKPATEDLKVTFRLLGPNGSEVMNLAGGMRAVDAQQKPLKGPDGKQITGVAAGDFPLGADAPGGPYTLIVSEAKQRFPEEKRKFLVNNYLPPMFNKDLDFHRKSYGPGEKVTVDAKATRAEGGALMYQKVSAQAAIDGHVVNQTLKTDVDGKVQFTFDLPAAAKLPRGEGSVTLTFFDGATPESIDRPIPIILNKLFVQFYPEGGDLIEGFPARVYYQAKTNLGKPADMVARIVDQTGKTVASTETFKDWKPGDAESSKEPGINQGMGLFAFTPEKGKTYELKIDAPKNIEGKYPLPTAKTDGVAMQIPQGVHAGDLQVIVRSTKQRNLLVGAYCRGRLLDSTAVTVQEGEETKVTLRPPTDVGGVYRVTVFERVKPGDYKPLAERLIFNPNKKQLELTVRPDQKDYIPGSKVKLHLEAEDEARQPSAVVALVSVVDLSLLKLADDRTIRTLPTHYLLTAEIEKPDDLEKVDVLLGKHPKASTALDLLLGTQGWRRFAEQKPAEFQNRYAAAASRLLVAQLAPPDRFDSASTPLVRLAEKARATFTAKQQTLHEKEVAQVALAQKREVDPAKLQAITQADAHAQAAHASFVAIQNFALRLALAAALIAGLALAFGLLFWGARRMQTGNSAWAVAPGALALGFVVSITLSGFVVLRKNSESLNLARPASADSKELAKSAIRATDNFKVPDVDAERREPEVGINYNVDRMEKFPIPGMVNPPLYGAANQMMPNSPPAVAKMRPLENGQPAKKFGEIRKGAVDGVGRDKNGAPDRGGVGSGGAKAKDARALGAGKREAELAAKPAGPMAAMPLPAEIPAPPGFGIHLEAQRRQDQKMNKNLRDRAEFEQLAQRELLGIDVIETPATVVLREYAHQHPTRTKEQEGIRSDFAETVYWHPALVFPDGKVDVDFDLSESTTQFQVRVLAHSLDGRLGTKTFEFASKLPFTLSPAVPFEVTATDKILLPIDLKNDTTRASNVELSATLEGLKRVDAGKVEVALKAKDQQVETGRGFMTLMAADGVVTGDAKITLRGKSDAWTDAVSRSLKIAANGFPVENSVSGLLEKYAEHDVELPASWVPGTLKLHVGVYPSTMSDLQKGLEAMLREPGGCFEQTSSSNYPNIMILSYLKEAKLSQPELEKHAKAMLERGYGRLISFECRDPQANVKKGYEWFGDTAPAHEALTAYGLLQFRDLARIMPIDEEMVKRTEKYLLDQRDGKGSFKRNSRAIDSFGRAPGHITDAYIVWALAESGTTADLVLELKTLREKVADQKDKKDPYFVALVALGHLHTGHTKEGLELLGELKALQQKDGKLVGSDQSITGSRGRDLEVETTSLALLGWLKANRADLFQPNVKKAIEWIGQQRGGMGGFGATQSTILALKALIAHTKDKKAVNAGEVTLQIGDKTAVKTAFPKDASETITLALADATDLKPGKNKVRLAITGGSDLPYTLAWSYQTLKPVNPAKSPVTLVAQLERPEAKEKESMKLKVIVKNESGKDQGMTMAIVGLPAGMTIPPRQDELKDLMKLRNNDSQPGVISYYEIRGRELVLYWRAMKSAEQVEVNLTLNCSIPGVYSGPASRAYLYYQPDLKYWAEPLQVSIQP